MYRYMEIIIKVKLVTLKKVGMDRIIYGRAYSSYICIENCRGEYLLLHACLYDSYLPRYTSYQVHSYLFSFFMRESFSSCS